MTENQLHGNRDAKSDQHLHWTSYKSCLSSTPVTSGDNTHSNNGSPSTPSHHQPMPPQRSSSSSLPPNSCHNRTPSPSAPSPPSPPLSTPGSPFPYMSNEPRRRYTPPPTPTLVKPASSKGKFPTTPPPQKRNKLYPEAFHPLTKSKSHESQLSTKVNQDVDISK